MTLDFAPIPSRVQPAVLAALAKPPAQDLQALAAKTADRLKEMFFPDAAVSAFFTCTREALYEIALNSFVRGPVLVCANGALSRQWELLAKALNPETEVFEADFDSALNETLLEKALENRSYDAVLLVEVEPLTGVRNDIQSLAALIHQQLPDTLVIVDCSASISSLAPLSMHGAADVVLFSSEISLGLPPGLGTIILNERANFKSIGYGGQGWSLNYQKAAKEAQDSDFRGQLSYPLLYALDKQLDLIFLEGLDNRIARIKTYAEKIRAWAAENQFVQYAAAEAQSPTVSVIRKSALFTIENMSDFLTPYGIYLGKCADDLKDDAFIIAHMGQISERELDQLIEVLNKFMADYDTLKHIPVVSKLPPQ